MESIVCVKLGIKMQHKCGQIVQMWNNDFIWKKAYPVTNFLAANL